MTTYLLIFIGTLLITACGFLWYFKKRNALLQAVFQQRVAELEDAVWRLQMNPHFLNNCLNSLNGFIHRDDKQSAARYLTSLSRLVRKLLEHSEEATITLADELDTVRQYVQMEQLRFGDKIAVEIAVSPDVDPESIVVPPLFIQPFVENALIHGLLPRQACGIISVEFLMIDAATLSCSITDNGVGRAQSEKDAVPAINKSLGIAITCKRIAAFNKAFGRTLPFAIHDLADGENQCAGTSVAIQLARVPVE
ncbi:sensor histidine kinase [Parapedobacter pyrenivorans]|uniref:sensor histidine kinase n=1 Tax=Parapedobacter pyrenivorans TaxID=1305674 RepID=UPI00333E3241